MSDGTHQEFVDAARAYASRGWKVLPLHTVVRGVCSCGRPDCASPGKHPRNRHGSRGATDDLSQITQWWDRWPDSNIGVATGPDSGLVVVDADGVDGVESLESLGLPDSVTVETGSGGKHIYYSYPEGSEVKNSASVIAPGVDVRGDGGFVVAPPSVHVSGDRYRFENTRGLVPALFPDALKAHRKLPEGPLLIPEGKIPSGSRNDTLTRYAGVFRNIGSTEDEIYELLKVYNNSRCAIPLDDHEVKGIAHSVSRYNPEDPIVLDHLDAPEIRVYTAKELCDIVLPDQDELVGPLLVRGNRLVVAGHTGEGKTTLALQLIREAIQGGQFLRWKGIGGMRVLVIDAEQGVRTIQRRLSEAGLQGEYPHYIRVPDGLNLDNQAEALLVEEVIAQNKYDIVVLDPLYKLHKGELTDERVSVDLMRKLDAWRERYRFGLLILAHCRKPGIGSPFTIHDVFGSTAVLRGAEVVLGLQRTGSGTSILHFFKDRDGDLPIGEAWELVFDQRKGFRSPMTNVAQQETDPGDQTHWF